jgi:hypothetical protein
MRQDILSAEQESQAGEPLIEAVMRICAAFGPHRR